MATLTIHEAATTTGWSARMLRYVEQLGLVEAARSKGGYRLYGPAQLQRLRTLRDLLERHGVELGDVGFARSLAALLTLSIAFCVVGGVFQRETPFDISLTHWDEAAVYGLLYGLVSLADQVSAP